MRLLEYKRQSYCSHNTNTVGLGMLVWHLNIVSPYFSFRLKPLLNLSARILHYTKNIYKGTNFQNGVCDRGTEKKQQHLFGLKLKAPIIHKLA